MARKPATLRDLRRLRAEMDELNTKLANALQGRARLVREIGRLKLELGLRAVDPARERAMLARVLASAPDGYSRRELSAIFRAIFAASREIVVAERRR